MNNVLQIQFCFYTDGSRKQGHIEAQLAGHMHALNALGCKQSISHGVDQWRRGMGSSILRTVSQNLLKSGILFPLLYIENLTIRSWAIALWRVFTPCRWLMGNYFSISSYNEL